MIEHEIEADIHLPQEGDVWAFGMVTVDQCIKFPVQVRKYRDKENEEEKSFISYPRREGKNGWEDVVHPSPDMRERITCAVGEAIRRELMKDLHLPEPNLVEVTPVDTARYPQNMKAKICGMATIQICDLTIKGLTIKQGERGLFVNMPQYKNGDGTYKDVAYATSKAMKEKIEKAVLDTYAKKTAPKTITAPKI